jgi:hypothetical protein
MLKYKLTSQDNMTRNNTLWGEGVTHETNGSGELCSKGWLHFYHTPELAVLLNPTHANIKDPKLWECSAEGKMKDDDGLKCGCTRLTTIREIPLPEITLERRIRFGILCARKVLGGKSEVWDRWAEDWLSGENRSVESARAASACVADANAAAACVAGAEYAARAACAARYAADAAAHYAAHYAARYAVAHYAAEYAAEYAGAAARYAARAAAHVNFDLQAIAIEALGQN